MACFIKRWSIETTFEESRAHLGFETQRQWSDLAIERTPPCLLSLYSLVALLASWPVSGRSLGSGTAAPVEGRVFFNINARYRVGRNPSGLSAGLDAIGLLHALT